MLNLFTLIEQGVLLHPNKSTINRDEATITYDTLQSRINLAAHALQRLGIGFCNQTILRCSNTKNFSIAFFGFLKTATILIPLSMLFKVDKIYYALTDAVCKAFFRSPKKLKKY